MNDYKKFLDKAKKDLDKKKEELTKQDKDFKELFSKYKKRYSIGTPSVPDSDGQVKESQQATYQAKDYPGKGDGDSSGPLSRMSNGGPVYPKGQFKDEDFSDKGLRTIVPGYDDGTPSASNDPTPNTVTPDNQSAYDKASSFVKGFLSATHAPAPTPTPAPQSDLEQKYAKIRAQNSSNASGKTSPLDQRIYNDGTSSVGPQTPNEAGAEAVARRAAILKNAGYGPEQTPDEVEAEAEEKSRLAQEPKQYNKGTMDVPKNSKVKPSTNVGNRSQALKDKEKSPFHFDDGTPSTPPKDPFQTFATTSVSPSDLSDAAKKVNAGDEKYSEGGSVSSLSESPSYYSKGGKVKEDNIYQRYMKLSGGLPAVPKLENPLAKVHAPSDKKYPLNIPRGAKIKFPKRLKSINSISGFDDGTDNVQTPPIDPNAAQSAQDSMRQAFHFDDGTDSVPSSDNSDPTTEMLQQWHDTIAKNNPNGYNPPVSQQEVQNANMSKQLAQGGMGGIKNVSTINNIVSRGLAKLYNTNPGPEYDALSSKLKDILSSHAEEGASHVLVKDPNSSRILKMSTDDGTLEPLNPILKNSNGQIMTDPKTGKPLYKFAYGTDDVPDAPTPQTTPSQSMDLGDVPINADVGPYPGEEEAAQDAATNSINGQMDDLEQDVSKSKDDDATDHEEKDKKKPTKAQLQKDVKTLDEDTDSDEDESEDDSRKPLEPMHIEGEDDADEMKKEEPSDEEESDEEEKAPEKSSEDKDLEDQYAKEEAPAEETADKTPEDDEEPDNTQKFDSMTPPPPQNPMARLKQAQLAQSLIGLNSQIGSAGDIMAASMGHYKPQYQQFYAQEQKNSEIPVQQLEQQMQMEKFDPNSATSQSFRQYLAKFGGKDVKDLGDISAAQAEQIAPMAFKQFEAQQAQAARKQDLEARNQERLQQAQLIAQQRQQAAQEHNDTLRFLSAQKAEAAAQSKADKDEAAKTKAEAAAAQQADQSLYGFRQPPDVKQARMDFYNSQKGLNTISSFENAPGGLDKMDPNMVANVRNEVQKIAQSGAPTEGGLNKFDPNTFSGSLASAWQRLSNKPSGANASAFLKEYKSYLGTMQDTAGPLINSYNQSILSNKKRTMNSDDYDQRMNSEYVAPYTKYGTNAASKQQAQNSINATVVKKGYNPTTNQTQLIYSDGTKKIVDGKQ